MQSLRLRRVIDGSLCADDLPLRMPQAVGIIDPEPFRARARGEGPALAEAFAQSGGMRTLHVTGAPPPLFDLPGPLLSFVISGSLSVATANRGNIALGPGDLFLADGHPPRDVRAQAAGDCRLVQVVVVPDWPGERARPVAAGSLHAPDRGRPNIKRMVRGVDDRSRFHEFPALFEETGCWSDIRPLIGLRFIGMADGTFIDWHPEIVNNLVIVLSGTLELEVGGGAGAVEQFSPGDICLAEDRTGEGHIDRAHGHVQVAVLILADEDLWP